MNKYFVVFKGFVNGFHLSEGNMEIFVEDLIKDISDIRRLELQILDKCNAIRSTKVDAIVITWYTLLETKVD